VEARAAISTCVALLALGCIGAPPDAPAAIILIAPGSICAHDGFRTAIELDGSRSAPDLTLVPVAPDPDEPPLAFEWRLEGAAHRIEAGGLDRERLVVRADGERPLHVTLTVTNGDGARATSVRSVSITEPADGACDVAADCLPTERCEVVGEGRTCVPDHPCEDDAGCEPCFVCDVSRATCVPAPGSGA
jgi:hypothetical protein